MKKLFLILTLFIPLFVHAQGDVYLGLPVNSDPHNANYNKRIYHISNLIPDLTFSIPTGDTTFNNATPRLGVMVYKTSNHTPYIWNGHYWQSMMGGGGSTDSLSFTDKFINRTPLASKPTVDLNTDTIKGGHVIVQSANGSIGMDTSQYLADGVISGLGLSISGSNVLVQPGVWRLKDLYYSTSSVTTKAIDAQDPTLSRFDALYGTNTNTIGIVSGSLSSSPVVPSIPVGTVSLGNVLITPTSVTTISPPITDYVTTTTNQTIGGNKTTVGAWRMLGTTVFDNSTNGYSAIFNSTTGSAAQFNGYAQFNYLVDITSTGTLNFTGIDAATTGIKSINYFTSSSPQQYQLSFDPNTNTFGHRQFGVTSFVRFLDTNDLPNLIAGTGISITGTYPNLTIAATGGGGTTTNPLSLTYGFTGQPLSFNGSTAITGKIDSTVLQTVLNFFPKADTRYYTKTISDGKYALLATTISPGTGLTGGGSLAANRTLSADTTVLQTVLNFFPKGDTRYAKIASLPTGATPTASIGFTAVAGSAPSFTRSDGAAKADSTIIRSVANSYSLSGMQTKLNNYVLSTRTLTGGIGILTIGDLSANRTISSDTTVLQTVLNFFPKGDTRWLKTTAAASTYLPLTGGTLTNSTAPQLTIAFDGTHTSQFSVNASGMLTISNTSGSISLQTILSNTYRNITATNNAQLSLGTTGGVFSRNVADANAALIVNENLGTGDILDLQKAGSTVAKFDVNGNLTTPTVNGNIWTTGTGTFTQAAGSTLQTTGAFTLNQTLTANSTPTYPTGSGTLLYTTGSGASLTGIPTSVSNADGTLTISPTTGAVVASIALGHANTWTAIQSHSISALGSTATDAVILTNPTAAAAGAQQYSPLLEFNGQGWKTTATAASQLVQAQLGLQTVQGTTTPSGTFVLGFLANSIATSGIFSFTSAGVSSFTGGTMTNKLFNTGAGNVDGIISTTTTASTAGILTNWAPTFTLTGTVWNTTATAASNVMSMRMGLQGISGTTPTSKATWNFGIGVSTPSYSGTNAMELTAGGQLAINTTQSTISGSTSGSAIFSEPNNGSAMKIVVIQLAALVGTASYTYPTAFVNTPIILSSSGLSSAIVTSNTTTSVTVTGTTTSGTIILMGY